MIHCEHAATVEFITAITRSGSMYFTSIVDTPPRKRFPLNDPTTPLFPPPNLSIPFLRGKFTLSLFFPPSIPFQKLGIPTTKKEVEEGSLRGEGKIGEN